MSRTLFAVAFASKGSDASTKAPSKAEPDAPVRVQRSGEADQQDAKKSVLFLQLMHLESCLRLKQGESCLQARVYVFNMFCKGFSTRIPPLKGRTNRLGSKPGKVLCMNVINMFFGVFVALISMLALWHLYGIGRARPQTARYGSQRMCRSCGAITPRSKACCVQCGKPLPAL